MIDHVVFCRVANWKMLCLFCASMAAVFLSGCDCFHPNHSRVTGSKITVVPSESDYCYRLRLPSGRLFRLVGVKDGKRLFDSPWYRASDEVTGIRINIQNELPLRVSVECLSQPDQFLYDDTSASALPQRGVLRVTGPKGTSGIGIPVFVADFAENSDDPIVIIAGSGQPLFRFEMFLEIQPQTYKAETQMSFAVPPAVGKSFVLVALDDNTKEELFRSHPLSSDTAPLVVKNVIRQEPFTDFREIDQWKWNLVAANGEILFTKTLPPFRGLPAMSMNPFRCSGTVASGSSEKGNPDVSRKKTPLALLKVMDPGKKNRAVLRVCYLLEPLPVESAKEPDPNPGSKAKEIPQDAAPVPVR